MYNQKVIKYFTNLRYYGKIERPDGVGKVGNPHCGDIMWFYLKIGKNKQGEEIIKEAKFETLGCVAALATSVACIEMITGKTIEQALKIKNQDIIDLLGGLPPVKYHCSLLAVAALNKAINDYKAKN
jgi:nitrogen fixation NifU-like protein